MNGEMLPWESGGGKILGIGGETPEERELMAVGRHDFQRVVCRFLLCAAGEADRDVLRFGSGMWPPRQGCVERHPGPRTIRTPKVLGPTGTTVSASTRLHFRHAFLDASPAPTRAILSDNPISVYGFVELQRIAERINGPTLAEVSTPLEEVPDTPSGGFGP